jgi:Uncharacterized protein conserved in bacteria
MRSEPDEWELEEEGEEPAGGHPRPQRRLPSRRSRRNRTRKPSFGFGHFMLPIVGLVAVGMLVLGIRMFFFPSSNGEITPQGVEDVQAISPTGDQPGKPVDTTSAGSGGEVVAVPEGSAPEAVTPVPKAKDVQPKPEVRPAVPKTKSPAPVAASGTSPAAKPAAVQAKPTVEANAKEAWNVQVGAFKDRSNAENLVKKLKQEGFPARFLEAKAGEAMLFKVLVQAGTERASAETLAKALGEKGYPVLVVQRP